MVKRWCQIWLCPVKQYLIWFKLRCLSNNSLARILYLKDYEWLLSQKRRVKNYFFGYRRKEELAEHIKPFSIKHKKGRQCQDYIINRFWCYSANVRLCIYSNKTHFSHELKILNFDEIWETKKNLWWNSTLWLDKTDWLISIA